MWQGRAKHTFLFSWYNVKHIKDLRTQAVLGLK